MSTLAELNSYSQNSVQFTSNLNLTVQEGSILTIPLITFDLAKTLGPLNTGTVTIATVFDLTGSPGGITDIGAIMTLDNVSATSSNIVIATNTTTITITNIITAEDYLAGSVGIVLPDDIYNDFSLTCVSTITNTQTAVEYIINTTIDVVDSPELIPTNLARIIYNYNATTAFRLGQYPQIVDDKTGDYTLTIFVPLTYPSSSYNNLIISSSSSPVLTSNTWTGDATGGTRTLIGTKNNINQFLRNLTIQHISDTQQQMYLIYTLTNPDTGFVTTISQDCRPEIGITMLLGPMTGSLTPQVVTPATFREFIHVNDSLLLGNVSTPAISIQAIQAYTNQDTTEDYIDIDTSELVIDVGSSLSTTIEFDRIGTGNAITQFPLIGSVANSASAWAPQPYSDMSFQAPSTINTYNGQVLLPPYSIENTEWEYDNVVPGSATITSNTLVANPFYGYSGYWNQIEFTVDYIHSHYRNYAEIVVEVEEITMQAGAAPNPSTYTWTRANGWNSNTSFDAILTRYPTNYIYFQKY